MQLAIVSAVIGYTMRLRLTVIFISFRFSKKPLIVLGVTALALANYMPHKKQVSIYLTASTQETMSLLMT